MRSPPPRAALLALAVVAGVGGCSRRAPITSCDQSLEGAWQSDHQAERWMILERGGALEVYPLFPDGRPPGTPADLETAPRAIDLARSPRGLGGDVVRRFTQRGVACNAKAAVHVTSCADDVLELVLADPPAPAEFAPCTFARPDSSRRERWRRE